MIWFTFVGLLLAVFSGTLFCGCILATMIDNLDFIPWGALIVSSIILTIFLMKLIELGVIR